MLLLPLWLLQSVEFWIETIKLLNRLKSSEQIKEEWNPTQQSNSQLRKCAGDSAHLASELRVVAPVSVCTPLARRTPSMRRADTLPWLRVTGVLSVSAVTGYNRDTGCCYRSGPSGQPKGSEMMLQVISLVLNNLNHSSSSWKKTCDPQHPAVSHGRWMLLLVESCSWMRENRAQWEK